MKKFLVLVIVTCALTTNVALAASPGDVIISEVVTDPQTDWSTNGFNGTDGGGAITSVDEYVELYNASGRDIDIRGWYLVMEDGTPATNVIDDSLVKNKSTEDDISAFPAGGYWILGNPAGAINNTAHITLYDGDPAAGATLIASVTMGFYDDGEVEDNAPTGNATSKDNEAVARGKRAANSGVEAVDFRPMTASPGHASPNTPPTALAGPTQFLWRGDTAVFDAQATFDFDQDPLIYAWDLMLRKQTYASFVGATFQQRMRKGLINIACLTVTDDDGAKAMNAVALIIMPEQWQQLYGDSFYDLPIERRQKILRRAELLKKNCPTP